MTQLHQEIASDQYWASPTVPQTERVPFASRVWDVYLGGTALKGIDRAYEEITEFGANVRVLQPGEQLALDVPGGLLKVVEDMRAHLKGSTGGRQYSTPELFDEQAQAMVEELFFRGAQAETRVEEFGGTVGIIRRTMYLQNSATQRQLAGKLSELIGRGGSEHNTVFMRHEPIGHVNSYETRKGRRETRIVSAEVITPSSPRPRRARKLIDLNAVKAKLAPVVTPLGALS